MGARFGLVGLACQDLLPVLRPEVEQESSITSRRESIFSSHDLSPIDLEFDTFFEGLY
jgi:hypothetical protein